MLGSICVRTFSSRALSKAITFQWPQRCQFRKHNGPGAEGRAKCEGCLERDGALSWSRHSNLIQGLAPEAVIVGGPIARVWPIIVEDLKASVDSSICRGFPSTPIMESTLGPQPTLMGALSLVLASKFASVLPA